MGKQHDTDITVILDRSGSMGSVVEETIAGFNKFVAEQKGAADRAAMTLIQFDDQYDTVFHVIPLDTVRDLTTRTYEPRGSTALLDAIGRTITETGDRLAAMPEADRPDRIVIVILTDGYENASRHHTMHSVSEMIRHQQDVYAWQFIFLGANQDAIATAATLHVPAGSALSYASTKVGVQVAFNSMSDKMLAFRRSGAKRVEHLFDENDRRRNDAEIRKQTGKKR